jgi:(1->4)-alpha-D-glucan 1-alpha-D-glucosylmutase
LNVLSEIPVEWKLALNRWHELSKRCKTRLHDGEAPDSNDEYFVFQTLVGAWPIAVPGNSQDFTERMVSCISKSIREAKRHTSWTDPNRDYEAATEGYIRKLLSEEAFLKDFFQFQRQTAFHGAMNSLSQTLLKLTSPGVPDFYQGTELWDLSLVDPDNRRPVDYGIRQSSLSGLKARIDSDRRVLLRDLLENWRSGCVKLFLIWQALALRNSKEAVFKSGDYVPLQISGRNANHVCAFARVSGREATITIVPRFTCTLVDRKEHFPIGGDFWGDTTLQFPKVLPKVHDVLTLKDWTRKNELLLGDVLSDFPVALLAADL